MQHYCTASAPRRHSGFTLIELIMVVILLGILAAVAVPRLPSVSLFQSQFDGRQVASSLARLRSHAQSTQCFVRADFTGNELNSFIEDTDDCSADLASKSLSRTLPLAAATPVEGLVWDDSGSDAFNIVFTPRGEAWFFGSSVDLTNPTQGQQSYSHAPSSRTLRVEDTTGYARWD